MSEPQHPLLQPVVIQILLEHVPKWMWKSCRLVCKPWHDELIPHWRKQMKVRIGGMGKSKLKSDGFPDNKLLLFLEVSSFLNTYQPNDVLQLDKFPFRSVKTVAGEVTLDNRTRESRVLNNFWTLCGPWLHRLHFHGVMFNDVNLLKKIIFRLTPNLKELEFSGCDVQETKQDKIEEDNLKMLTSGVRYRPGIVQPNLKILKISLQAYWKFATFFGTFPLNLMNLLSVFTNLEELHLKGFDEVYLAQRQSFIAYLVDVIKTIRLANQNSVLNIKTLDIENLSEQSHEFTPDLVTKLCALSLPIEELHFDMYGIANDVHRLLSHHPALTKLFITNITNPDDLEHLNSSAFQFESLSQTLRELHLKGKVFDDWSFLTFTPKLTKLDVCYGNTDYEPIQFPETFSGNNTPLLESLTSFSYKCCRVSPIESVQVFTKIMPNVKKLTLSVGSAGFEMVCNSWPQLTYWEITLAYVTEAVFTANINKLTNLTCLKMNVSGNRHVIHQVMDGFGNDSIQNGFLGLPRLQRLCITLQEGIPKSVLKGLYEKVKFTEEVYITKDDRTEPEKCRLKNFV